MNIHGLLNKINPPKDVIEFNERGEVERFPFLRRFFLATVIILIAGASFGIGELSNSSRPPVQIKYENLDSPKPTTDNQQTTTSSNTVTASAKGTKYYFSWCGNTISEKNKMTFQTAAAAEAAGYALSATCKPK